jgi:hypothetical protein
MHNLSFSKWMLTSIKVRSYIFLFVCVNPSRLSLLSYAGAGIAHRRIQNHIYAPLLSVHVDA